ncbi:MAG: sulfatase-like hydrolase/transferase [Deltaproteobacteria bacterium]|nr:sulfatase-like hydrolase/transferase [Deltaproteobacteria bacterium]
MKPSFITRTFLSRPTFKLFLAQSFLGLGLYTLFRFAFLSLYWNQFSEFKSVEIAFAMLHGLRFDVSVLAKSLALLWLVTFLLPQKLRYSTVWLCLSNGLTYIILLSSFVVSFIDLFYYPTVGRRLTFELFTILNDLSPLFLLAVTDYLLPFVLSLLFLSFLTLTWAIINIRFSGHETTYSTSLPRKTAQVFAFCLILIVSGRGGSQAKPLMGSHAFQSVNLELGYLSLNAPFTVLQSLRGPQLKRTKVVPDQTASQVIQNLFGQAEGPGQFLNPDYPFYRALSKSQLFGKGKGKNIVLIIMESWPAWATGAYGSESDATPAFDRWASRGRLYTNFMAAGSRSVEGISAIFGGIAPLPKKAFLMSSEEQNRMTPLPAILAEKGYNTIFIHGAFRGSLGIHNFARRQGFLKVLAEEDLSQDKSSEDGVWGIWDHLAFQRLFKEIDHSEKPFFAGFFSVSFHEPYALPVSDARQPSDAESKVEWRDVLRFSDSALGDFLDSAKTRPWFENTLFVITADHQMSHVSLSRLERSRIPLLIIDPSNNIKPGIDARLGSQVDLMPTLVDYLGIENPTSFMGTNLLGSKENRFALYSSIGMWWFEDKHVDHFMNDKHLGSYNWREDSALSEPLQNDDSRETRARRFFAYIQSVEKAILDNKIAPSPKNTL